MTSVGIEMKYSLEMSSFFHDGGPYYIETPVSYILVWILYERDLRHKRVYLTLV